MTSHPLVLAVLALHVVGLALLAAAATAAFRVVLGWSPEAASAGQLALERAAEAASFQARAALAALAAGDVVLVAAIATALPTLVPGAMCGTGVLEAMRGAGGYALGLDAAALLALVVWRAIDRLDASRPDAPLATTAATALLVAFPAQLAASIATMQALLALDTHHPVDCCSVVYARATPAAASSATEPRLVWIAALGAALLLAAAMIARSRPGPRAALALALVALPWTLLAALALVRVLAAYRYEVLSHECPWCLFLPEHGLVGYPLFGALAVVTGEAVAALTSARVARAAPTTEPAARLRVRDASARIGLATIAFVVLAGWPAVRWYVRFGVWMHGGG
jgi:hypothetical protein